MPASLLAKRALWRLRESRGSSLGEEIAIDSKRPRSSFSGDESAARPDSAGTDGNAAEDSGIELVAGTWQVDNAGTAAEATEPSEGSTPGNAGGKKPQDAAGKAAGDAEQRETLEIMLEDGLHLTVELDSGERLLNELGYKQELKRRLSFFEVFSIGLSTIIIYAGVVPFYARTYMNGGAVALVWYWWLAALFTHCVALTFAEVSSSFPISGSLYFWAAALAGPKHGPFAAWITGWLEFFGISVGLGGVAFGGVQLLQYTIYAATGGALNGGYLLSNYECFGITVGVLITGGLLTSLPIQVIGGINVFTAVWQILLTLVIIIVLPCVAVTTQPASFVFTHYHVQLDQSHLPNAAYAFVVAMQLPLYGQYSYDTVAHMAEETKHADRTIPAAMVSSLTAVCVLGWGLIVSLTFCIENDERLLGTHNETRGEYPVVQIIWDVFSHRYGSGTGAVIILSCMSVAFFLGVVGGLTGASRAAYSLSRDSGLPFAFLWRRVNRDRTPVYAVWLCCSISIIFATPLLNSTDTFFFITSLATVSWVGSYSVPIFFRLIQRDEDFHPGAFNLADYVGSTGRRLINLLALFFVVYTIATFLVPIDFPITASNFNYACVGVICLVVFFISWWLLDARHWFVGPYQHKGSTQRISKYSAGRLFM
ncbi:hypothetical protein CLOM_g17759 [Closterium sp. NIES-68]|nr:hypothetical protein CLOM_g17759 [Closterium sp. NIES-68]GJP62054.1 hypothetical protein CLOP_g19155 [Closterium sp. NIES-67]